MRLYCRHGTTIILLVCALVWKATCSALLLLKPPVTNNCCCCSSLSSTSLCFVSRESSIGDTSNGATRGNYHNRETMHEECKDESLHEQLSPQQLLLLPPQQRRKFITSAVFSIVSPTILSSIIITSATTLSLPAQAISSSTTRPPTAKDLKEDYRQGTAALADMNDSQAPVPREAYQKLDSGVIYADLRQGIATGSKSSSEVVRSGSQVNLQWVLRRSNGYFVDSSERNDGVPFIFVVGDGTAIAGLDEGVRGMKQGGIRRILIPPALAYVQGLADGLPGPLPKGYGPRQQLRRVQEVRKDVPGEYIYLEVQLTRLR